MHTRVNSVCYHSANCSVLMIVLAMFHYLLYIVLDILSHALGACRTCQDNEWFLFCVLFSRLCYILYIYVISVCTTIIYIEILKKFRERTLATRTGSSRDQHTRITSSTITYGTINEFNPSVEKITACVSRMIAQQLMSLT